MKRVAFLAEGGLRCGAAGINDVEPTSHAGEKKLSKMARGFQSWVTVEWNLPHWELSGK